MVDIDEILAAAIRTAWLQVSGPESRSAHHIEVARYVRAALEREGIIKNYKANNELFASHYIISGELSKKGILNVKFRHYSGRSGRARKRCNRGKVPSNDMRRQTAAFRQSLPCPNSSLTCTIRQLPTPHLASLFYQSTV